MARAYQVFNSDKQVARVVSDRVFSGGDGRLTFINSIEGKQYGETVAAFAPGHWSHFTMENT